MGIISGAMSCFSKKISKGEFKGAYPDELPGKLKHCHAKNIHQMRLGMLKQSHSSLFADHQINYDKMTATQIQNATQKLNDEYTKKTTGQLSQNSFLNEVLGNMNLSSDDLSEDHPSSSHNARRRDNSN